MADRPRRIAGQPDIATRHPHGVPAAGDCSETFALVVGAGPAGLAVAARLMHLGVPFVAVDKNGAAGASWAGRYDRLHLHTHKSISALPFWPFPEHFPEYVAKTDLADYYAGYSRLLGPHLHLNTTVTSARRVDGVWVVKAMNGRVWRAQALVICTGQEGSPYMPALRDEDAFAGELLHSSRYASGARFRGKRVLVVGFGNSGSEIALDLWEHAANVTVLVRSPVNVLPRWLANLPFLGMRPFYMARYLTPLWLSDALYRNLVAPLLFFDLQSHGLRRKDDGIKSSLFYKHSPPIIDIGTLDLIRRDEIKVINSPIEFLTRDGVRFEDGYSATFDAVVLATGYDKTGAPHSRILSSELLPELLSPWGFVESGASAAAPALYFSGFTDHSGRLAEIYDESALIASQIARDNVPLLDASRRRVDLLRPGGVAHQAAGLPPACEGVPRDRLDGEQTKSA